MTTYQLDVDCVSGDTVQVHTHRRESVVSWLRHLDHEGATWTVHEHECDGDIIMSIRDVTKDMEKEYHT